MLGKKHKAYPSRTRWLFYGIILGFVLGLAIGAGGLDAVVGLKFGAIADGIAQAFGMGGGA